MTEKSDQFGRYSPHEANSPQWSSLAVQGYRSLRDLRVPLGHLTLLTGPNGSGKSNVYRALRLLSRAAQGDLIDQLAREGGMESVLWAGPEQLSRAQQQGEAPIQGSVRRGPVRMGLGVASEQGLSYQIRLGLPIPRQTLFGRDADIKSEALWWGSTWRDGSALGKRLGGQTLLRANGQWQSSGMVLNPHESWLAGVHAGEDSAAVQWMRQRMKDWRFYDHFRVDAQAPARQPQIGSLTTALDDEGRQLAAAIQTIREIGDGAAFDGFIQLAIDGARVEVQASDGYFSVSLRLPGLLRPLRCSEWSDGMLRWVLLVTALLTPRPPSLMILNEPESSLHPDHFAALGQLLLQASRHSQLIVVSHAARLIATLEGEPGVKSWVLEKSYGATEIQGQSMMDRGSWAWVKDT